MMSEAELGERWRRMAMKEGHRGKLPKSMSEEEKKKLFKDYIAPRTKEFVLMVAKHPYSTSTFIGKTMGMPRHTVNATLNRLAKNHTIERVKGKEGLWLYFATPEQKRRCMGNVSR